MAKGGSNELLTVREAAAYLGLSPRALERNWQAWGIPRHKVGRYVRFRVRDLEQYLERNRDEP